MDNNQEKGGFSYTYSAKEQAEIKKIRDKYTPQSEEHDKMARLRKLDASVTNTAQAIALAFGVIGSLILGFGMSLCMSDLGKMLGMNNTVALVIGVITGVIGGFLASFAYPVHNYITKTMRKRVAPEIIRLTDELMK